MPSSDFFLSLSVFENAFPVVDPTLFTPDIILAKITPTSGAKAGKGEQPKFILPKARQPLDGEFAPDRQPDPTANPRAHGVLFDRGLREGPRCCSTRD